MAISIRSCGRTHCPPGEALPDCRVRQARLQAVPSTLLIPLAARAHGARLYPWLDCHDTQARHLLDCLEVDCAPLLRDRVAVLNVLWRTRVIMAWAEAFFRRHPEATGVALGCGLSHYFQWLDTGVNRWIDADLPEVCALRDALLPPARDRRVNATVDLSRAGWWDTLHLPAFDAVAPLFLVCEGVLMYLPPAQVRDILAEFAQRAPAGSVFVLDAISHLGVGQARHSVSVGPTGAEFRWGLRQTGELLDIHPRLSVAESRSVSECYGWMGWAAETLCLPWSGAPLYSLVALSADPR